MKKSIIDLKIVEDHPIEDVLGEEIQSGETYYELPSGEVLNEVSLGDYLVKRLGAVEYEAK